VVGIELTWKNDDLILYHGCSDLSLRPKRTDGIALGTAKHGIDPSVGARKPDFGSGFYATTWLDQAKIWANVRTLQLSRSQQGVRAIVIEFAIKRNDLAELECLVFTNERGDYFPFVRYCRQGRPIHARSGTNKAMYDVVYGPVSLASAKLMREMVAKDSDQVSFHTSKAVAKIPAVRVAATGNPLFP
jgi:hypothetical protein